MSSAVSFPTPPPTPPAPTAITSPPRCRVTGDRCLAAPFPDAVAFCGRLARYSRCRTGASRITDPPVVEWLAVSAKGVLLTHAAVKHSEQSLCHARPFEPERKWSP